MLLVSFINSNIPVIDITVSSAGKAFTDVSTSILKWWPVLLHVYAILHVVTHARAK